MEKKKKCRIFNNSAIGSWAGYIYQGLCGIYYCLRLIAEDREKYKEYKLYLDSYEDFAIMDGRDKLVSLHQCKDEKNVTDYTAEFTKMRRKLKLLDKECDKGCKLYFHTNKDVKVEKGIFLYPFTETQKYCEPVMLFTLIENQVKELLDKDSSTVRKVACFLEALIEQKVLEVHQRYIYKLNKETLRDLAKKYAYISFQTIIDTLFVKEEVFSCDRDNYIRRIKYKLINDLGELCNEDEDITDEQKIRVAFLNERLQGMNVDEVESFLMRVHPIDNILQRSVDDFANVSARDKSLPLFNVISELDQLEDDLSWNTDRGKETPTSLNKDRKMATLCKKIIENKTNINVLYEYDWMVGDVRETIDDIGQYLPTISDVANKTSDGLSIFEIKKVGLVSKQDKIDGKYGKY